MSERNRFANQARGGSSATHHASPVGQLQGMRSCEDSAPGEAAKSPDISQEKTSVFQQTELGFSARGDAPGSFDDAAVIRGVLVEAIKRSGKSRAAIAQEMEFLLARSITDKMLDAFTAETRDRRWPAEYDRAFCKATGDNTLLACRAQLAGFHVITEEEKLLLDLGRQIVIRTQAEEQIAILERRLHGRVVR